MGEGGGREAERELHILKEGKMEGLFFSVFHKVLIAHFMLFPAQKLSSAKESR